MSEDYLLACVLSIIFSANAGGLKPIAFSAYTLNENSDLSLRLSIQYFKQFASNVTILLHFVEVDILFSIT